MKNKIHTKSTIHHSIIWQHRFFFASSSMAGIQPNTPVQKALCKLWWIHHVPPEGTISFLYTPLAIFYPYTTMTYWNREARKTHTELTSEPLSMRGTMQTPGTTWMGWGSYYTCSEVRLRTWIPQEKFLHIPWPHHLWEPWVPEAGVSSALGNLGPYSPCRMKQSMARPSFWWLVLRVISSLLVIKLHVKLYSLLQRVGAEVPSRT